MIPRIALTGGIASGKSTVAAMFVDLGATIIDSDVLAREVVEPGTDALAVVVERFGDGILCSDGTLDRAALGQLVFRNDAARADLNAIIHPLVRKRRAELQALVPANVLGIQVIPLLVETGLVQDFDEVIVVDVPHEVQLERLIAREHFSTGQAQARIEAQASRSERLAVATKVIDNTQTIDATRAQVAQVASALRGSLT